jgi:hypothetical protein
MVIKNAEFYADFKLKNVQNENIQNSPSFLALAFLGTFA